MKTRLCKSFHCVLMLACTALVGCADNNGPSSEGRKYLLTSKPTGEPSGVVELKNALIVGTATDAETLLVGRIGGGQNETWDQTSASFLVRDLDLKLESAHEHDDNHDDNCKFCQAERAQELASMALIQIVDESGIVVTGDARELLGLKQDQVILAQGTGDVLDGNFVFSATQVYVQE